MAVGRANYNATVSADAPETIIPANASRQKIFLKSAAGTITFNFGATATAANVLTLTVGQSIELDNSSPYDIRNYISAYSLAGATLQAQAEEMAV